MSIRPLYTHVYHTCRHAVHYIPTRPQSPHSSCYVHVKICQISKWAIKVAFGIVLYYTFVQKKKVPTLRVKLRATILTLKWKELQYTVSIIRSICTIYINLREIFSSSVQVPIPITWKLTLVFCLHIALIEYENLRAFTMHKGPFTEDWPRAPKMSGATLYAPYLATLRWANVVYAQHYERVWGRTVE